MDEKRHFLITVGLTVLICAVLVLISIHERDTGKVYVDRGTAPAEPFHEKPEEEAPYMKQYNEPDPVAYKAKEKYGENIDDIRTQIAFIEELIAYFSRKYPDDWLERVEAYIRDAFPEDADEILDRMEKLQSYNRWLSENNTEFMAMPFKDKSSILWEKRIEIFGSDAEVIWASDLKNERLHDVIDLIGSSPDMDLEEKLDLYIDTIQDTYGQDSGRFIQRRGFELMNAFLQTETVQDDLHDMYPEQRWMDINDIRRAMGIDDDAIKRLEDLDAGRDKIWEKGELYMRERKDIIDTFEGLEQEDMIDEIREEYFGKMAPTIKTEEKSGFFRFEEKRIYGVN